MDAGEAGVTLQPAAGAHGELRRDPDDPQGARGPWRRPATRCSSLTRPTVRTRRPQPLPGYKAVEVPSGPDGTVDLEALDG